MQFGDSDGNFIADAKKVNFPCLYSHISVFTSVWKSSTRKRYYYTRNMDSLKNNYPN